MEMGLIDGNASLQQIGNRTQDVLQDQFSILAEQSGVYYKASFLTT